MQNIYQVKSVKMRISNRRYVKKDELEKIEFTFLITPMLLPKFPIKTPLREADLISALCKYIFSAI